MDKRKSNLALRNGSIYTVDADRSWAQAIAIAGDKIVYVGPDDGLEAYIDSGTKVIDLAGKMVLPGFVDAHAHPSHAMDLVSNVNLYGLTSVEAYQAAIAEFVGEHPEAEVIRGSGWDNELFPGLGPGKEILDAIVPDRPVRLTSSDGHSSWVNSVSLDRAQLTIESPDPEGGLIEREQVDCIGDVNWCRQSMKWVPPLCLCLHMIAARNRR